MISPLLALYDDAAGRAMRMCASLYVRIWRRAKYVQREVNGWMDVVWREREYRGGNGRSRCVCGLNICYDADWRRRRDSVANRYDAVHAVHAVYNLLFV